MFYTLKKDTEAREPLKTFLQSNLRDYNRAFFGAYTLSPFSLSFETDNHTVIAGVSGFFIQKHQLLRIEFFWVDENHRQQGLGRALMSSLESFALESNCPTLQVSTMAFQGVGFYEKMGFQRIGIIPQWFCGVDEYYYLKQLVNK